MVLMVASVHLPPGDTSGSGGGAAQQAAGPGSGGGSGGAPQAVTVSRMADTAEVHCWMGMLPCC